MLMKTMKLTKEPMERCHPKMISWTKSPWATLFLLAALAFTVVEDAKANQSDHSIRDNIYKKTHMSKYSEFKNCIYWEAKRNQLDELVLMAVILAEFGDPSTASKNNDGTNDYSIMQINDVRMNEVAQRGYDTDRVKVDGCYNIKVGSEILASEIKNAGNNLWVGIGRYHYHEKGEYPHNHYKYRTRVASKLHDLVKFAERNSKLIR